MLQVFSNSSSHLEIRTYLKLRGPTHDIVSLLLAQHELELWLGLVVLRSELNKHSVLEEIVKGRCTRVQALVFQVVHSASLDISVGRANDSLLWRDLNLVTYYVTVLDLVGRICLLQLHALDHTGLDLLFPSICVQRPSAKNSPRRT